MTEKNTSGFSELEHTADWALHVWAPDMDGLFREAARGMYALMDIQSLPGPRFSHEMDMDLESADAEGLLVMFLSELLYIGEHESLAFDSFDLSVDPPRLHAWLEGAGFSGMRKEIKAVTYHKLAIQQVEDHLEVTIVFDV